MSQSTYFFKTLLFPSYFNRKTTMPFNLDKLTTSKLYVFLATAFMLIASRVIFLFHRVIIEEYCIKIVPYRKNTCSNHPFVLKTDVYKLYYVPVSVWIVQYTYQNPYY